MHAWPQGQGALAGQIGVGTLLGRHEGVHLTITHRRLAHLVKKVAQPLTPSTHGQQLAIGGRIPPPGQAGGAKGGVVGLPMTLELGFRQGAIHIPEKRSQCHGQLHSDAFSDLLPTGDPVT